MNYYQPVTNDSPMNCRLLGSGGIATLLPLLFAICAGILATAPVWADPTPFSRIIVFGDSLSDTGNFYHMNGGLKPPAPYFNGRFSNGPLWIEYLADDLGMQLLPEDSYAVGGATTGHDNSNDGFAGLTYPGLQDEIAKFLGSHQGAAADPDALYVVWAGANDFLALLNPAGSSTASLGDGVRNTIQAVLALYSAGARQILVLNVPDLGVTPLGRASGFGEVISQGCAAYNQSLETNLDALAAAGIPTIRVDSFSVLRRMVDFPMSFGFTNVSEPFLAVGGDPDWFLFWDPVHPTTRGHRVLADEARDELVQYYSPRRGRALPPAVVNSLNGLVHSHKGGR